MLDFYRVYWQDSGQSFESVPETTSNSKKWDMFEVYIAWNLNFFSSFEWYSLPASL